jgi:hypothetical protein
MLNERQTKALIPLLEYCATSPAIECDEGYWDDMESANWDGQRQAQSSAAAIMRVVLRDLGIEPPEGLETCPDCFNYADAPGRGIDHDSQCKLADEEDEEIDEDKD